MSQPRSRHHHRQSTLLIQFHRKPGYLSLHNTVDFDLKASPFLLPGLG